METDRLEIGYPSAPGHPDFTYGPVDLEARRGELVGIIGRNGIGKSTLLRTLAGLQQPLKGSIRLEGSDMATYTRRELSRIIGFVSTEIISAQNMRVYEVVSAGRYPHTNWLGRLASEDHDMINAAIEQAGIFAIRMKFLHQLSDGERQKTMIARVLAQDTPVIVLDEPTAFLDLPSRYEILRLMNRLSASGDKTIIFSTHDLDIARYEADKIWLMAEEGMAAGAPEDLLFSRLFHKLFLNSQLEYDDKADGFRLKKTLWRTICLKGEGRQLYLTQKALERIGYQWTEEETGAWAIEAVTDSGKPVWLLQKGTEKTVFASIYELTTHLKNHNH